MTPLLDNDPPVDLSKLAEIIQPIVDRQSSVPLASLNTAISNSQSDYDFDPLSLFPLLLPSTIEGSEDLLKTIGFKCSPREAIIALQEAVERLLTTISDQNEDLDEDILPLSIQLARVLIIYSIVLPRLNKRKKTASEILKPLMTQVQGAIPVVSQQSEVDVQAVLDSLLLLTRAVPDWIGDDPGERNTVATVLYDVLQEIVQYNSNGIQAGLTEQAFGRQYPNLRVPDPSTDGPSEDQHPQTILDIVDALAGLGFDIEVLSTQPSLSSLILIAHSARPRLAGKALEKFLPIVLAALQSNTALDETLSLLLNTLGPLRNATPRPELTIDVLIPLVHVLAPLANIHPDPPTRHATFRILSIILTLSPSVIRMRILKDLVTDEDESMQQMRVAAVGLVKEAVLEALSLSHTTAAPSNVFSSPVFMQEIGSILFLQHAESIAPSVTEFLESAEPLRLIESMGLLYVLLVRDTGNKTGVRNTGFLRNVQSTLLEPLKRRLGSWEKEAENSTDIGHMAMQLGIIDMWLDKLSSTIGTVSV